MKFTNFINEIETVEPNHDAFGIFFTFAIVLAIIAILFLVVVNVFHWQPYINGLI
jgi:hypothetical protein